MLRQATFRLGEYEKAFVSGQWNVSVREAQEAFEQCVKAAIMLTGNSSLPHFHGEQVVESLKTLLDGQVALSINGRPEVAARVLSIRDYYLVTSRDSRLSVRKKIGGVYTELLRCDVGAPNRIVSLDADGSTLTVSADEDILAQVTDTALSSGFPSQWYFPVKPAFPSWSHLCNSARVLAKMRDPAFYEEIQYGEAEARQAGDHLRAVLVVLRDSFGAVT